MSRLDLSKLWSLLPTPFLAEGAASGKGTAFVDFQGTGRFPGEQFDVLALIAVYVKDRIKQRGFSTVVTE